MTSARNAATADFGAHGQGPITTIRHRGVLKAPEARDRGFVPSPSMACATRKQLKHLLTPKLEDPVR